MDEPTTSPKSKTEKELIPIRLVTSLGGVSAVVEWFVDEQIKRCVIPLKKIIQGPPYTVEKTVLEAGVMYGELWENINVPDAKGFANRMRLSGLWTLADVERNTQRAFQVVRAFGIPFSTLVDYVYHEEV